MCWCAGYVGRGGDQQWIGGDSPAQTLIRTRRLRLRPCPLPAAPDAEFLEELTAANQRRVEIREGVKERVRAEASETGEPVTTSTTLRYQHDLDTRETQSRLPRLSAAALAERARSRNQQNGELDPRYKEDTRPAELATATASACVTTRGHAPADRGGAGGCAHPTRGRAVKDGTNHRGPGRIRRAHEDRRCV